MVKDFDLAVTNKIKTWFTNTIYANTAIVYNVAFNLVEDPTVTLKFPLVSIYRPEGMRLNEFQSFAARRQGVEYFYDNENNRSSLARFLVANLAYQLDVYARTPESLIDISEDIMQALNFDPVVVVEQVDKNIGQGFTDRYELTYNNGPVEQSEFTNDDRVYHYSLVYEIRNARIANFRTIKSVDQTEVEVTIDTEAEEHGE